MKTRLINSFLLLLLLHPLSVWSQKLNIDGEKIRIAANGSPTIVFPGEIQNFTLSCPKENYNIRFTRSSITIRAAVEQPVPCTMFIYEGTAKKQRAHRFILEFVEGQEAPTQDELYHNFSTLRLLEDHVKSMGATAAAKPAARPAAAEQPKKGRKGNAAPADEAEAPVVLAGNTKAAPAPNPSMIEAEGVSIDKKEFERRAIQKTEALGIYLKILCEKNQEKWNPAIEGAVALFTDEDRSVEVTNTDAKTGAVASKLFKIRVYLKRMTQLRYDRVDISWSKMQYVSNLREQPDGSYMGIVTFEQDFKAYRDGRQIFGDKTRKNAEVKLKLYKKLVEGREKISWDVLLGNIGVSPVG
jgi:hypothetical protein